MTYICLDCGNHQWFKGRATESVSYADVLFDAEGDVEEIGESADTDLDSSEVDECETCGSADIEDVHNIDVVVYAHTKKDGTWSEEELKEEERNEEVRDKIVEERI